MGVQPLEQIDFVEQAINGQLPQDVTCIRGDFIGTSSGNPTSDVIWSFRQDEIDTAPRFVIAKQIVQLGERTGLSRHVLAFGPLRESEYKTAIGRLAANTRDHNFMNMYQDAVESQKVAVEITVPDQRTTERIMSTAVELILLDK